MEMTNWIANIWVKCDGKAIPKSCWSDLKKECPEVEKAWTTSGDWDMCIWLKKCQNPLETAEKVAWWVRNQGWAADTSTSWAKEMV